MKSITALCAALALTIAAVPAHARDRDRDRRDRDDDRRGQEACKPMLKERGDRAANREDAIKNAFKAWEIAAKNSYGVSYAKSENAWTDPRSTRDNPNCFDDPERWIKKWECTWEAKPCDK